MDNKRAEEIMQSHGVINVNYNGMPVWIESLHERHADVTFIGFEKRAEIPVSELNEGDPLQTI